MADETIVQLVPVTADNWRECAGLSVGDDQRPFLPANLESIAAAQFYPDAACRAAYADGRMVGFAMYGVERPTGRVKVFRLMIASAFQSRGLGTAVMRAVLGEVAERWPGLPVYVSYQQGNAVARHLYVRLGFREVESDGSKVTASRPGTA